MRNIWFGIRSPFLFAIDAWLIQSNALADPEGSSLEISAINPPGPVEGDLWTLNGGNGWQRNKMLRPSAAKRGGVVIDLS
jgi:hypothetical protein